MAFRFKIAHAPFFACLALVASSCLLSGQVPTRQLAEDLLENHWKRGIQNRQAAEIAWQAAGGESIQSPDLMSAFVINRVQQGRSKEAREVARQLTQRHPDRLDGWELRGWLDARLRDFDQSLIAIQELNELINSTPDLDPRRRTLLIRRLGRLIGYLEGPVQGSVNKDLLDQVTDEILANLKQPLLKEFEDRRKLVQEKLADLNKQKTDTISTETDRLKRETEQEIEILEDQRAELNLEMSRLQPQLERVQREADREISAARDQLDPLRDDLLFIEDQIEDARWQLFRLQEDLSYFQRISRRHVNIPFVFNSIRNVQFDLTNLYSRRRSVQNQLWLSEENLARLRTEYDLRELAVRNEIERLDRDRHRNQKRLVKLAGGKPVAAGKINSIESRATALTTYDPLSLERWRQDLQDRLIR